MFILRANIGNFTKNAIMQWLWNVFFWQKYRLICYLSLRKETYESIKEMCQEQNKYIGHQWKPDTHTHIKRRWYFLVVEIFTGYVTKETVCADKSQALQYILIGTGAGLCSQLTLYTSIKVILDTVTGRWLVPKNPENWEINSRPEMSCLRRTTMTKKSNQSHE